MPLVLHFCGNVIEKNKKHTRGLRSKPVAGSHKRKQGGQKRAVVKFYIIMQDAAENQRSGALFSVYI